MKTNRKLIPVIFFLTMSGSRTALCDQDVQAFYENEAMKCKDIACIRNNIDQINDQILDLLVKRTAYVQRAGDLKLHTKIADDRQRVKDQLLLLGKKSEKLGLSKEISVDTFQIIIEHSIQFQQKYINKKLEQN